MVKLSVLAATFVALSTSAPVLGQGFDRLIALSACRLDEQTVALALKYWGGACEAAQDPEVSVENGIGHVTFPTFYTRQICTMQLVQVPISAALTLGTEVTGLEAIVLAPEGNERVRGKTSIAPQSDDCAVSLDGLAGAAGGDLGGAGATPSP